MVCHENVYRTSNPQSCVKTEMICYVSKSITLRQETWVEWLNDREIDTIDKVCVLDQRFESLEHPVQENTTRQADPVRMAFFLLSVLSIGTKWKPILFDDIRLDQVLTKNEVQGTFLFLRKRPPGGANPKSKKLKDLEMWAPRACFRYTGWCRDTTE